MNKITLNSSLIILLFSTLTYAADMGVPIQLRLKSPTGEYPTASGINFKLMVLTPGTNCVLRDENFISQSITEGSISLNLGSGARGANDPNLTLNQVYDNSKTKTGLVCLDANNNVVSTGQSYIPTAIDRRVIRITATVGSDLINVNFNMRSTPYAVQAESVGGKAAADILTQDTSTQLNQANLADLLFDVTRFNNLKTLATSGVATTSTNFTGSLTGDVTGTQTATSVTKIRGVTVSTSAPNTGDVLQYNGTQYVPVAIPSAPVSSVAGRTGAITLTTTDIGGLGGAALLNVGTTAGTVAAGDDTRIVSAYTATNAATAGNSPSTLVKRDASGNVAVSNISSLNASTNNMYLYSGANSVKLQAPTGLAASYTLVMPADDGALDQVLKTDGAGNLSWGNPASAGVTAVSASAPLASSGGANPTISIPKATTSTDGYLSSVDWTTFNSKQNALGYVPLDEAIFNNAVASASCTTSETLYWNSVTSQFLCQSISFPTAPVTSVAGRAGDVVLSTSDISGLGGAALLDVGTTAGTVAAGDDTRIVSAYTATNAATSTNTVNTIVKRDGSGNFAAGTISATASSYLQGANSVQIRAPGGLASSYILYLPTTAGSNNQVLTTNGSGNLFWQTPTAAGVSSVTASAPLTSSGGATPNLSISQASGATDGYLSSADWTTFNNKQDALGFVPLDEAVFNNAVASASCTTSETLYWNSVSSQFLCQSISFPAAPVTSVAGRTGDVVLSTSDISGLGGAALLNVGTTAGTVAAGDDSRIVSSNTAITASTSINTASTIVKRDASGNFAAGTLSVNASNYFSGANSVQLRAPAGLGASYTLTLPADDGANNQVLTTDGSGNLSWQAPGAGSVVTVTASAPLASSGGTNPNITMTQANGTTAGYLSATDWTTFNNKQATLGYTPLDQAYFNNAVATASCTTSQSLYWNSVSSQFLCQNISFPVTSVAGQTGAVTLTTADIGGLGTAANQDVGVAAGNVVQLDGSARLPSSTLPTEVLTISSTFTGDVSGTNSTMSVDRIKGTAVSATAPTTGQALVYNGTAWVPTTGFPSFARVTANQTFSVTALANVTGLSFNVIAGNAYRFKFTILYTSAATTTGLRLGLTYPAVTSASALANIASGADGTGAYFQGLINTSGDSVVSANSPSATATLYATVEGVIVPSANGAVQLQAATEIAASNIVIRPGSMLEVAQVP